MKGVATIQNSLLRGEKKIMEGQMLALARQLQTAPPSLPHWKSPPRIGYLYDGKVIAKKNEYLVLKPNLTI